MGKQNGIVIRVINISSVTIVRRDIMRGVFLTCKVHIRYLQHAGPLFALRNGEGLVSVEGAPPTLYTVSI